MSRESRTNRLQNFTNRNQTDLTYGGTSGKLGERGLSTTKTQEQMVSSTSAVIKQTYDNTPSSQSALRSMRLSEHYETGVGMRASSTNNFIRPTVTQNTKNRIQTAIGRRHLQESCADRQKEQRSQRLIRPFTGQIMTRQERQKAAYEKFVLKGQNAVPRNMSFFNSNIDATEVITGLRSSKSPHLHQ